MRRFWSGLAACSTLFTLLAACGAPHTAPPEAVAPTLAGAAAPVTIFLTRHAEKAADDPNDPNLSDAGHARAEALAALLEHAGATHFIASEWKRTQQTLEPLAKKCGGEIETLQAGELEQWVKAIEALPAGSVAVIAGHSNTIPPLVHAFGATLEGTVPLQGDEALPVGEYGRLMMLVLPPPGSPSRAATTVIRLQY